MNDLVILILPTFYPYPYLSGETPLDVMSRWAKEASESDPGESEATTIVESGGCSADSTIN